MLTRRQWGSKHQALYHWRRVSKRHLLLPRRPVDTVWQHITVTNDTGKFIGNFRTDMQTVERIGYDRFKSGVSYNLVVDMHTGLVGIGMPFDAKGTHTVNEKRIPGYSYDQNYVSIAIAFLGMPGDVPSPKAVDSLLKVHSVLRKCGIVTPHYDYEPHSLVQYKDCPTNSVREIMPLVYRRGRRLSRY